jgi:outer membrane protein OmpA-like peptidoglycan-associated protein
MSKRWLVVLTVVAQLSVTPGLAQQSGTIELGGFGSYTFFDSSLPFDDAIGGGGWLGVYLLSRLSLEGEASYATADSGESTISHIPFRARLVYNQPLAGNIAFLLGAGFVHNEYRKGIAGADNGVTGLVGLRLGFPGPIELRVSGAADYILTPANGEDKNLNLSVQAGLGVTIGPLFGRGAGEGPQDSDHDGVTDQFDACPGTPRGERVDLSGCPLPTDADGDGVADRDDACPGTPAGTPVDARGCLLLFQEGATRVVLEGVTFESGGAELTAAARQILDRVAESLIADQTARVEIAGHTDDTGYRPYNLSLSLSRAASVRSYLISRGVGAERLQAKGYGPDDPVASNETPEGRARNQRIELRRLN